MADFEKGHIPGSKNVQMSQFDPENKQLASATSLPVVLVCKTGQTAGTAAKRLKKAGFEQVHVLDGGIAGWQQPQLALARGKSRNKARSGAPRPGTPRAPSNKRPLSPPSPSYPSL